MIPMQPSNTPTLRRSGEIQNLLEFFTYMGEVFTMIADDSDLDPATYEEAMIGY